MYVIGTCLYMYLICRYVNICYHSCVTEEPSRKPLWQKNGLTCGAWSYFKIYSTLQSCSSKRSLAEMTLTYCNSNKQNFLHPLLSAEWRLGEQTSPAFTAQTIPPVQKTICRFISLVSHTMNWRLYVFPLFLIRLLVHNWPTNKHHLLSRRLFGY